MNIAKLVDDGLKIGMLQHREEIFGLASFLAATRPHNVMEIGSWKGGFFNILCNLVPDIAIKISVDLDAYGDLEGTIEQRNEMMRSWSPNVHTIIGNSHEYPTYERVKQALGDRMLDFLLIDGDHSYEGSKTDWEMYSPMCCGWVAFHDIVDSAQHQASGCFVNRTWEEVSRPRSQKWEISLGREWGGIGLVRV